MVPVALGLRVSVTRHDKQAVKCEERRKAFTKYLCGTIPPHFNKVHSLAIFKQTIHNHLQSTLLKGKIYSPWLSMPCAEITKDSSTQSAFEFYAFDMLDWVNLSPGDAVRNLLFSGTVKFLSGNFIKDNTELRATFVSLVTTWCCCWQADFGLKVCFRTAYHRPTGGGNKCKTEFKIGLVTESHGGAELIWTEAYDQRGSA